MCTLLSILSGSLMNVMSQGGLFTKQQYWLPREPYHLYETEKHSGKSRIYIYRHTRKTGKKYFWCSNLSNSLASGRCGYSFKSAISKHILQNKFMSTCCETVNPQNTTDGKSTLVQIAWCCPATNHHLSPCWPRSMPPYGVTRPQWIKIME